MYYVCPVEGEASLSVEDSQTSDVLLSHSDSHTEGEFSPQLLQFYSGGYLV